MRIAILMESMVPGLVERLNDAWRAAQDAGPAIGIAALVFVAGLAVAGATGAALVMVLRRARFNEGVEGLLARPLAGAHEPAAIAGVLVRWSLFAVAAVLALDALGVPLAESLAARLGDLLPRIVVAALLLVTGTLFATGLGALVRRFFESAGFRAARLRGQVVTIALTLIAFLLALEQLGFAAQFVMGLGLVAAAAIGLGVALAFGLGCRDLARDLVIEYLRSLEEESPRS